MDEHLWIVAYDIRNPKRWRKVFKIMNGYGEWLQLSVFQCRMSRMRHAALVASLDEVILNDYDHVVMLDLGPADGVKFKVMSLGKPFESIEREAMIV